MATGATVQTATAVLATKGSCGARGRAHAMNDNITKDWHDVTELKIMKIVKRKLNENTPLLPQMPTLYPSVMELNVIKS